VNNNNLLRGLGAKSIKFINCQVVTKPYLMEEAVKAAEEAGRVNVKRRTGSSAAI
jgi:hypothetical protein